MGVFREGLPYLCGSGIRYLLVVLLGFCFLSVGVAKDLPSRTAVSYLQRGIEFYLKGELDRAIADYNIAIAFDRGYTKAYNNRGLAHLAKGQVDLAVEDY